MAIPYTKSSHGGHTENKSRYEIKIIKALVQERKPLTKSQIEAIVGVEICTLDAPLLEMVNIGTLYIVYNFPCPISGIGCFHYALIAGKWSRNVK